MGGAEEGVGRQLVFKDRGEMARLLTLQFIAAYAICRLRNMHLRMLKRCGGKVTVRPAVWLLLGWIDKIGQAACSTG